MLDHIEKKVTQVWSQDVSNLEQTDLKARWGFGDLLRGANNIHGVCLKENIEFDIDLEFHPISKILEKRQKKTKPINKKDLNFISFNSKSELKNYIQKKKKNEVYFVTNGFGRWDYENINEFQKFIIPILKFNKYYTKKADAILPLSKSYNVLHIRLGDKKLFGLSNGVPRKVKRLIKKRDPENTYLITDSAELKKYVSDKKLLKTLPFNPSHSGVNSNPKILFGTILEFMLMSSANKIETFSVYDWVSGFANSASFIYEVPMIDIKKNSLNGRLITLLKKFRETAGKLKRCIKKR